MNNMIPIAQLPSEYKLRVNFNRPLFSIETLQGIIIDEAIDKFKFNMARTTDSDNGTLIELKKENNDKIKEFVIAPSFMEFSSNLGENFPIIALEHFNFIFNKLNYSKGIMFFQSVEYLFNLNEKDITEFIDNFSTFKTIKHSLFDTNVSIENISYRNIYKINNKNYRLSIYANKINIKEQNCESCEKKEECEKISCNYNLSLTIENKERKDNKEQLTDKEIKSFLKLSLELVNSIGIKVQ